MRNPEHESPSLVTLRNRRVRNIKTLLFYASKFGVVYLQQKTENNLSQVPKSVTYPNLLGQSYLALYTPNGNQIVHAQEVQTPRS